MDLLFHYINLLYNISSPNATPNVIFNIAAALPSIFLFTFVYMVMILYVISTRFYLQDSKLPETVFHKVMFILLIFSFIGFVFFTYQNDRLIQYACPQDYTIPVKDRFVTPENAVTIDVEAYYNRDKILGFNTGYYSSSFKEKLNKANITFEQFKEMENKHYLSAPMIKVDTVEILSKKNINNNEVYIQYRTYFKPSFDGKIVPPKQDFAYMIKINNEWKVDVEPEFEEQLKK